MTPEQQAAVARAQARVDAGGTQGSQLTPEQQAAVQRASQASRATAYDVIRTLPDGSQVIQFDDGSRQVLNQEAGLASRDPDVVAAAMRGESPVEAAKKKRAEEVVQQAPAGARAASVLQGVPFVGSYFDEIMGAISGREGDAARVRGMQTAMETARPSEALGLQLAGGVTGGGAMGMASGGGRLIERLMALPRAQKVLGLGAVGGGLGATEGAIYGYGQGETPEERGAAATRGGIFGGLLGGVTGGAMPLIGDALASGFANVRTQLNRQDLPTIAKELNVSPETAKVIQSVVQQGDATLDDMLLAIDRAGEQGMIADADVATQVLLDAAAAAEGGAAAIVRKATEERAQEAGRGLGETLEETVSPRPLTPEGEFADVQDVAQQISRETAPQRREAYNEAYSTPIDYSAQSGQKIESIIGRIPTGLMRRAIQEANDQMRVEGIGQRQIMADIDDAGNVTFIEMPNTTQVDYIKRALGQVGQEVDQLGRPTAEAARANRLYGELNEALGEAVPAYRQAVALGGDKIGRDRALQIGSDALKTNVSARDLTRSLAGLDEGQRLYARVGLRDAIERTINNVKTSIASPDVDINALRDVLKQLSSNESRAKVRTIIGSENAEKLFRELEKANAALSLRAAVARNSATAIRQSMQRQIGELTEPGAIQSVMQGEPLRATQQVTQAVTGATAEYTEAQKGQIMKEIARAMTQARGEEAKKQLRTIYNAVKENKATNEQMAQAANFLTNQVTLPATLFGIAATQRGEE